MREWGRKGKSESYLEQEVCELVSCCIAVVVSNITLPPLPISSIENSSCSEPTPVRNVLYDGGRTWGNVLRIVRYRVEWYFKIQNGHSRCYAKIVLGPQFQNFAKIPRIFRELKLLTWERRAHRLFWNWTSKNYIWSTATVCVHVLNSQKGY